MSLCLTTPTTLTITRDSNVVAVSTSAISSHCVVDRRFVEQKEKEAFVRRSSCACESSRSQTSQGLPKRLRVHYLANSSSLPPHTALIRPYTLAQQYGGQQWCAATKARPAVLAGAIARELGGGLDAAVQTDSLHQAHECAEQPVELATAINTETTDRLLRQPAADTSTAAATGATCGDTHTSSTFARGINTTDRTAADHVSTSSSLLVTKEHSHRADCAGRQQIDAIPKHAHVSFQYTMQMGEPWFIRRSTGINTTAAHIRRGARRVRSVRSRGRVTRTLDQGCLGIPRLCHSCIAQVVQA